MFECDSVGKQSLSTLLELTLAWKSNLGLGECFEATGVDVEVVYDWYEECNSYFKKKTP